MKSQQAKQIRSKRPEVMIVSQNLSAPHRLKPTKHVVTKDERKADEMVASYLFVPYWLAACRQVHCWLVESAKWIIEWLSRFGSYKWKRKVKTRRADMAIWLVDRCAQYVLRLIRLSCRVSHKLTSHNSSEAASRCLIMGCDSGDSMIGSIGSRGLMRCANTHSFGSEISSTLSGLCLPSTASTGGGNYKKSLYYNFLLQIAIVYYLDLYLPPEYSFVYSWVT